MNNPGKIFYTAIFLILSLAFFDNGFAQQPDSVDVTFFHKPQGNPNIVYLPGEFNNWGNNVNGNISDSRFAMSKNAETGIWSKTIRLRVGGPSPLPAPGRSIAGAYQYKFNENGSSNGWLPDPLNPRQNPRDFNNSYLFINNPAIHYLLPNSVSGLVETNRPEITAYIFPSISSTVDAGSIRVVIDATEYTDLSAAYEPSSHFFSFVLPEALSNGDHTLKLFVESSTGTMGADSTTFMVQAGFVQLFTRSNERHLRSSKRIIGSVEIPGSPVTLVQNETDTVVIDADANGQFEYAASLVEGENTFKAFATDANSVTHETNTIAIKYVVDHAPKPLIFMNRSGNNTIELSFQGNDPDGDALSVSWISDDAINPAPLGLNSPAATVSISIPHIPGEYFIDLAVTDPDANTGTARTYFDVDAHGGLTFSDVNNNPHWVRDAIVYEIYVPAFTPEGTLAAAKQRLAIIKSLGANIIWLMPIYENGESINELNAGYNITNFFKVHPQLGTLADFQDFLQSAHELGIRVILDSTPNHVSGNHAWVKDIEIYQDFSNFRPLLEDQILGDNRGLGQSPTKVDDNYVAFVHYSNWHLANLDFTNIETVDFMLNMYKWWVLEQGIDGYRMDVYWGPQNRYGKNVWWRPFREEIKRVRPDIFILSETDGTGFSSENNYADFGGASDAAYDWSFYGGIKGTLRGGSLNDLDNRVRNFSPNLQYNHFTGPNAHYFRFLENHDETRIAQEFRSDFQRTEAGAALLFTIPGIPLIYAGQEVGETSRRGKIHWNRPGAQSTFTFYQRLASIRNTFSTFRSPQIKRISSSAARVYAFLRPLLDQNGIGVVNFSGVNAPATLIINESDLQLSSPLEEGATYYLNDVLNDTSYTVTKSSISDIRIELSPWGSAVFVLADSVIHLVTSVSEPAVVHVPEDFQLLQNYPNPFNPTTTIRYELPHVSQVTLEIYDLLGKRTRTLVNEVKPAGEHIVRWDGRDDLNREVASGVFVMRLTAGGFVRSIKVVKLK